MEEPPEWTEHARCRELGLGIDPKLDIFFGAERGPNDPPPDTSKAKAICCQCPVQSECLEYALETGSQGVWGGTDDEDRRKMQMLESVDS